MNNENNKNNKSTVTKDELNTLLKDNGHENLIHQMDNLPDGNSRSLINVVIPINQNKKFPPLDANSLGLNNDDIEKYSKISEETISEAIQKMRQSSEQSANNKKPE